MDNNVGMKTSWWESHKPTKRRIIQLYSALLYNAHLRGFAEGKIFIGASKAVCVPGFNCYSCPGAVGACPLGSIQNALGSLNKHIGFYVLGIILLYGMLLGRTICGWICPLGLIQELLHKIPTPKLPKSKFTRMLSYLKYIILVIFVVIIPVYYGIFQGIPVPGFCKYICPAGTFEGAMGMLPKNLEWLSILGPIFTRKFVIMVIIGLACIFCYRSFCRFLCPLGAIYGMFNKLAVIGVKVDAGKCNNCGACVRFCKMDVKQVGDHECIHCGQCIGRCNQNALSLKAGKFTLVHPKKGAESVQEEEKTKKVEKIAWTVAVVLLAIMLIWTNFLDPSLKKDSAPSDAGTQEETVVADAESTESAEATESTETTEAAEYQSDAPIGYEVGNRLQNFEVTCLDGSTFNLNDAKGKVVVINLWGTFCGPCVKELPHFVDFYHEHEGDVVVLAVHPHYTSEELEPYLADKGWDIPFVHDDADETIFKIVNGSLALPQTIVLNKKGEVVYNKVGSVTPEVLEELFKQASAE